MDEIPDEVRSALMAAADQQCAEATETLDKLIKAHREDSDTYKRLNMDTVMSRAGNLGMIMLRTEMHHNPIGLCFLLALAVDKLSHLPEEMTDSSIIPGIKL